MRYNFSQMHIALRAGTLIPNGTLQILICSCTHGPSRTIVGVPVFGSVSAVVELPTELNHHFSASYKGCNDDCHTRSVSSLADRFNLLISLVSGS